MRSAIIPSPGFFLAELDYKNAEYRLAFDYANEGELIRKIKEEGMDVHEATAQLMGVSRKEAKTINFMLLYGGGAKKLAAALKCDLETAYAKRQRYFDALPKISAFIESVTRTAERRGFILNWAGRCVHFPDPRFAYKAPNSLAQGGCGDIAKRSIIDIDAYLHGKKSRLILNVHDSNLLEVAYGEEYIIEDISKIMVDAYPYRHLPQEVDVKFSNKNWGSMQPWEGPKQISEEELKASLERLGEQRIFLSNSVLSEGMRTSWPAQGVRLCGSS